MIGRVQYRQRSAVYWPPNGNIFLLRTVGQPANISPLDAGDCLRYRTRKAKQSVRVKTKTWKDWRFLKALHMQQEELIYLATLTRQPFGFNILPPSPLTEILF